MVPQPVLSDPVFLAHLAVFAVVCLARARNVEDPDARRGLVALLLLTVRVGPIHCAGGDDAEDGALAGFYVEDDGPGIPAEEREQVFESGYATAEDGTGFGLSIVSEIVEAHGWEVAAAESDSGGARFELCGVEPAERGGGSELPAGRSGPSRRGS